MAPSEEDLKPVDDVGLTILSNPQNAVLEYVDMGSVYHNGSN